MPEGLIQGVFLIYYVMRRNLKAWLKKNQLTTDPNDYMAVVAGNGSIGTDQIIDEIVEDGSEIKRETILNIISRFNNKAADLVLSGYNVNTGLVYMRPVIKGVFYNKSWNPEVNSVYVAINQGADLRAAVAETTVEILGEQSGMTEILSITDTTTGKTDGTLTKGRNAEIKGSYLKIEGEDGSCGISFTSTSGGATIKLDSADLVLNEPSRLLILVPSAMEAGEYELSITTQYCSGGKQLKQTRTATMDIPVVIA